MTDNLPRRAFLTTTAQAVLAAGLVSTKHVAEAAPPAVKTAPPAWTFTVRR